MAGFVAGVPWQGRLLPHFSGTKPIEWVPSVVAHLGETRSVRWVITICFTCIMTVGRLTASQPRREEQVAQARAPTVRHGYNSSHGTGAMFSYEWSI